MTPFYRIKQIPVIFSLSLFLLLATNKHSLNKNDHEKSTNSLWYLLKKVFPGVFHACAPPRFVGKVIVLFEKRAHIHGDLPACATLLSLIEPEMLQPPRELP